MFAISFGICNGSGFTIPLKICWDLFPNNKGMVTGVISCGFGVGSFLFGIVSTMLINPENQQMETIGSEQVYGSTVADRIIPAMRVLAVCWALMTVIALLLIKINHPDQAEISAGDNNSDNIAIEEPELSLLDLIKDKRFWLLYFMNFCSIFYGYTLIGSYKVFGAIYIRDDLFLTYVGSIGCIFGSLRFFWSLMLDLGFTYQQVYGTLCFVQLICASQLFQTAQQGNKYGFLRLMAISMFCEGGHFVLLPSHCAQVFGSSKRGVKAFSLLFSCFGMCSLSGGLISARLQEWTDDPFRHLF